MTDDNRWLVMMMMIYDDNNSNHNNKNIQTNKKCIWINWFVILYYGLLKVKTGLIFYYNDLRNIIFLLLQRRFNHIVFINCKYIRRIGTYSTICFMKKNSYMHIYWISISTILLLNDVLHLWHLFITAIIGIISLMKMIKNHLIRQKQSLPAEHPTWISFQIFSSFLRLFALLSLLRKIYWSSSALVIKLQPVTSHKFSACDLKKPWSQSSSN